MADTPSPDFVDAMALSHDELEVGTVFAPKFDANGLVTAIAADHATGAVLMVAFMNAEALAKTLESGDVHYFSRSRNRLWKKGESSGEVQRLVEIRVDCDQDALLVIVNQTGRGAACHTGRASCFYRKVEHADAGYRLSGPLMEPLFDPDEVYKR